MLAFIFALGWLGESLKKYFTSVFSGEEGGWDSRKSILRVFSSVFNKFDLLPDDADEVSCKDIHMDVCNEDPHPPASHRSASPTRYDNMEEEDTRHEHPPRRHAHENHERLHVNNLDSQRAKSGSKDSLETPDAAAASSQNHAGHEHSSRSSGDDQNTTASATNPGFVVNRTYASVDNPTSAGSEHAEEGDERRKPDGEVRTEGDSNNHDHDHDNEDGELQKVDGLKTLPDGKHWTSQLKKVPGFTNGPLGYPPGLLNGNLTTDAGGGAWTSSSSDVQTPGKLEIYCI